MKQYIFQFLFFASTLLFCSCENDDNETGTQPDPEPSFQITFHVVDSAGNLVFPVDGDYLSEYNPEDFHASSEFTEDIGHFNSNTNYGHVFRIIESRSVFVNNENIWLNDSIVEFYSCFGFQCDTIKVFNPFNSGITSSAERIYWNGDTIFNYKGWVLPYQLNN